MFHATLDIRLDVELKRVAIEPKTKPLRVEKWIADPKDAMFAVFPAICASAEKFDYLFC